MKISTFETTQDLADHLAIPADELLNARTAAIVCGVTTTTIYEWGRKGKITRYETPEGAVFHVPGTLWNDDSSTLVRQQQLETALKNSFRFVTEVPAEDVAKELSRLRAENDRLLGEKREAEWQQKQALQRVQKLKTGADNGRAAELESEIQQAAAELDSLRDQVKRLTKKNADAKRRLKTYSNRVQAEKKKRRDDLLQISGLQEQNNQLRTVLDDLVKKNRELAQSKEALEESIKTLEFQLSERKHTIKELLLVNGELGAALVDKITESQLDVADASPPSKLRIAQGAVRGLAQGVRVLATAVTNRGRR